MSKTLKDYSPSIRVVETDHVLFYHYVSFGQTASACMAILAPSEAVREYYDSMYSTKGVNNNCAHWRFKPCTLAPTLDNVNHESSIYQTFVTYGQSGSYAGESTYMATCRAVGAGHQFLSSKYMIKYSFSGTALTYENITLSGSSNHYDGHLIRYKSSGYVNVITDVTPVYRSGQLTGWKYSGYEYSWDSNWASDVDSIQKRYSRTTYYNNRSSQKWRWKRSEVIINPEPLWHFGDTYVTSYLRKPKPTPIYADILAQLEYDSYLNSLDQFSIAADNNIANLQSAIDLVKNVLSFNIDDLWKSVCNSSLFSKLKHSNGSVISVLKKYFGDLWLKYRYVFTTTVSDIKEIDDYAMRRRQLRSETWRVDGYANGSDPWQGTTIKCHCGYRIKLADEDPIVAGINKLYELSFLPTGYVIWDMIPFSFVADWFLHFGDFLGQADMARYVETHYDISEFYYTLEYTAGYSAAGIGPKLCQGDAYTRYYSSPPQILYGFAIHNASRRTMLKRVGDVMALTTIGG